ncbi:MAG: GC-type dockerin domain-anchored protein [Phycisphaerales bacterium]
MTRTLPIALALLTVSGAAADITSFDKEDPRAIARESDSRNNPIARRAVPLGADSGVVFASAPTDGIANRPVQVPIWSTEVEVADAAWVRLRFGQVTLSPATDTARESYIRITSLYDGHEQYLDSQSIREWSNTSAYFNGSRLLIEIMASPTAEPNANRVQVTGATASEPTVFPRSICGPTDDRVLSSDPRDARMMPIGCTGWLFGDQPNSFLSAGHCSPGAGDVMQFNVPLSTAGGTPQNPGPEDQYPIDPASVQNQSGSIVIGNDWAFYGAFDNSNTGLAPQDAQGASHTLASSMPPADNRPITITGFGSTSSPVSPTWYLVQKTHTGPFTATFGNTVQYRPDTTGGNSGSAILDQNNNQVLGIHTNAGCNSTGGANQGCSLFNSTLQAALANPQGIAQPLGLDLVLVGARPDTIAPAGGDMIAIEVLADNGLVPSGPVTMFVDSGSGYMPVAMTNTSGDTHTGMFPAADCGGTVSYYFAANDNEGGTWQLPSGGAAGAYTALAADGVVTAISEDFQTGTGWTVQDGAGLSTGSWDRAVPGDYGRSDPAADGDGSGLAYVTGNGLNEDVDGGETLLISPNIDISGLNDPIVSFAEWHESNDGGDFFTVEFSTNNGASWTLVNSSSSNGTSQWVTTEYRVSDFVSTSGTLRVRFGSRDIGSASITESGVDAFEVIDVVCGTACAADLAEPFGTLNFFDVSAFIAAYNAGDAAADLAEPFGTLNFFDVSAYISSYNAGCP